MKGFFILVLVFVVTTQYGQALIEPMQELPTVLQECFDNCYHLGDLRNQSGQIVFWTSVQKYLGSVVQSVSNMSISETRLLDQTLYEVLKPVYDSNPRRKRQTSDTRVRQEVRTLSNGQRQRYFNAVNRMKYDRRLTPNVYDVIARMHTGNVERAHTGPAFPSWHRLYLYIFESILRLWYDGSVTIPYWDSVLDQRMGAARSRFSVIWSSEFFGNNNGVVRTGPFANWRFLPGQPIRRATAGGQLFTEAGIGRILSRRRNWEILIPTGNPANILEFQHNPIHTYVGGTMQSLETAAFDPIFFSHHAFVDYIWELFRLRQRNFLNPETDYYWLPNGASGFITSHNPVSTAGFISIGGASVIDRQFGDLRQRDGYSNRFFELVRYIDTPTCRTNCDGSPFLYCQPGSNRCVSRTAAESSRGFGAFGGSSSVQLAASQDIAENPEIPQPTVNFSQETQMPPNNRMISNSTTGPDNYVSTYQESSCDRQEFIDDVDTKQMRDSGEWAYIPVNVVSKRPDTIKGYKDYSLYNPKARWANPNSLGFKYEFTKSGSQYEFEDCKDMQGSVGRIRIVSWGLNYNGYAQEDVIVDNRLGVSQGNGFLPIRKPTAYNPSEFITVAYDSCGRVCKPYCSNNLHDHINDHFSGGFRATTDSPQQYANSYEEAMLSMWEMVSPSSSPIIDYGDIPITYFCEYTDDWIWEKRPPSYNQMPNERIWENNPTSVPPTHQQPQPSYNQMPNERIWENNPTSVPPTHQQPQPSYNQMPNERIWENNPTSVPPTHQQPQPSYNQMPTNHGSVVVPDRIFPASQGEICVVAPDCTIDVPCGGCADFDYQYCRGEQKLAICMHGTFSDTTAKTEHTNHFYSK